MISELSFEGIPSKAIIQGIKDLCHEDLKSIKYVTIVSAARKYFQFEPPEGCATCFHTGFISMVDKELCPISVACTCPRGNWFARNQEIPQWNGRKKMQSKTRGMLELTWHYEKFNIPEISDEEFVSAPGWE